MRPGPSVLRGLIGLIVGLGSYVTGAAWTDRPVACPATGIIHCQTVLTGPGHRVAGLPLAFWGVLWALAGLKWPGRL
ncbi:hypothetical protein BXT84_00475 [Sulfobacillus thermotolerans]|uniref:Vitamin K epoxide reductase domain-containing protein n=1 Tax=Sulfobacillus thermotolerans TaxID=338644 RepID=A0ABM6RMP6_9FIRM|nr:hypothetical protein BXT84_00475 [Sulfobacillus thermotolerans]